MCASTPSGKPANRVRICRMLARYSQKDLAFLLGVPATTVSKWENWLVSPSVHYAIGLSVACHRLVDEIFPDCRRDWIETVNRRAAELEKMNGRKSANDNGKR